MVVGEHLLDGRANGQRIEFSGCGQEHPLYSTTGGQGAPSERSIAQALSKLASIARTTARSLELVTLHLHSPPHVLDRLGIAASSGGAELGHTLGLAHCSNAKCVMHFSNSLADTDRKGSRLCAACERKTDARGIRA